MIDLPTLSFDAVYHVGSMQLKDKQVVNLEGDGLSVSQHPLVWRYLDQGWIRGDIWKLARSGNRFLDRKALSVEQCEDIMDWAVREGLGTRSDAVSDGLWGSDALWSHYPGLTSHQGHGFDFALMVYLQHSDYDGMWWNEPLRVRSKGKGGWAPRGTIFRRKLNGWTATKITEADTPDRDLFTKSGLGLPKRAKPA